MKKLKEKEEEQKQTKATAEQQNKEQEKKDREIEKKRLQSMSVNERKIFRAKRTVQKARLEEEKRKTTQDRIALNRQKRLQKAIDKQMTEDQKRQASMAARHDEMMESLPTEMGSRLGKGKDWEVFEEWVKWKKWWDQSLLKIGDDTARLEQMKAAKDGKKKKVQKLMKAWQREDEIDDLTEEQKHAFDQLKTKKDQNAFLKDVKSKKRQRSNENDQEQQNKKQKRTAKCRAENTLYPQRVRTLGEVVIDTAHPDLEPETTDVLRTKKVRLFPTTHQRQMLHKWMGTYRYSYNSIVALHQDQDRCQELFGVRVPPDQDVRKHVMDSTPIWGKETPYNLRELAPREFTNARKVARKLHPNGDFEMSFKSLRRSRRQTVPLGDRCLVFSPEGVKIFQKTGGLGQVEWKLRGDEWQAVEGCLDVHGHPPSTCKLVFDRGKRTFELHIPIPARKEWVQRLENQEKLTHDVIALDPGVRTFQTGYSPSGVTLEFGNQDAQRLCRLANHIDKLSAKIVDPATRRAKRKRYYRARLKIYARITNLVDEVHWQMANVLCREFDVILIPEFGVKGMTQRRNAPRRRCIGKNTVRRMLMWAHYRFRQRLLYKAKQHGKTVVVVNEAYTSKTCTVCGHQHQKLGGAKIFKCPSCGLVVGRDVAGARNILLRAVCEQKQAPVVLAPQALP